MKLTKHLKSLENAAIEREARIAEMNARHCELQAELLIRNQALVAIQAEMAGYDSALIESRRMVTERIEQRHAERQRLTSSSWWKAASLMRELVAFLRSFRRHHLRNRIRSLEALVSSRDEQINGLNAQAETLTDVIRQKDQLLADLSAQAAQRRLEVTTLDKIIHDEGIAYEVMLNEFLNSNSWKVTAPLRATASAMTALHQRASQRRAKRRGLCLIEPVHQLTPNPDGSFTSTGEDPQFNVQHVSGSIPHGWVQVSFDVLEADAPLQPVLYTDSDANFTKAVELPLDTVEAGRVRQIVRIPDDATQVRFDPTDCEGKFAITNLSMRRISRRKVVMELLKRSPQGIFKTLSEIRRQGVETVWNNCFAYRDSGSGGLPQRNIS